MDGNPARTIDGAGVSSKLMLNKNIKLKVIFYVLHGLRMFICFIMLYNVKITLKFKNRNQILWINLNFKTEVYPKIIHMPKKRNLRLYPAVHKVTLIFRIWIRKFNTWLSLLKKYIEIIKLKKYFWNIFFTGSFECDWNFSWKRQWQTLRIFLSWIYSSRSWGVNQHLKFLSEKVPIRNRARSFTKSACVPVLDFFHCWVSNQFF